MGSPVIIQQLSNTLLNSMPSELVDIVLVYAGKSRWTRGKIRNGDVFVQNPMQRADYRYAMLMNQPKPIYRNYGGYTQLTAKLGCNITLHNCVFIIDENAYGWLWSITHKDGSETSGCR